MEFFEVFGCLLGLIWGFLINPVNFLSDKIKFAVVFVNSASKQETAQEQEHIKALFIIATSITPFLSKAELKLYWKKILEKFKRNGASQNILNWIRLYDGIGQENPDETLKWINIIFSASDHTNQQPEQYHFIITTILSALIKKKEYHSAKQFLVNNQILESANFEKLHPIVKLLCFYVLSETDS